MMSSPNLIEAPLVSVVIPIFNHARFVVDCLESVASQGYAPIEVLALDDGSSDASYRVASDWAAMRGGSLARCIVDRQRNAGICPTLNRLVQRSSGAYVLPLASDDMLAENAIAGLVRFHRQHCSAEELLFTNVALVDLEGRRITDNAARQRGLDEAMLAANTRQLQLAVLLRWGNPFQHQFYPRRFYELVGGYDETVAFEDVYLAVRALALSKARFAPIVSKKDRIRPDGSITPGLDVVSYSAVRSRTLAADGMDSFCRFPVRIANIRDARPSGLVRAMSEALVTMTYRSLRKILG
jgi:glycosyltransferase involved in cell wall biosynthesis